MGRKGVSKRKPAQKKANRCPATMPAAAFLLWGGQQAPWQSSYLNRTRPLCLPCEAVMNSKKR